MKQQLEEVKATALENIKLEQKRIETDKQSLEKERKNLEKRQASLERKVADFKTEKQQLAIDLERKNIETQRKMIENERNNLKERMQKMEQQKNQIASIPGFDTIEDIQDFYELQNDVGDGNFALVWKSRDIQTGEFVAVKHIEKRKVVGKHTMLKDEVNIMKDCDHENIVKLFTALETPDSYYLCMEFVSGGDLFDLITDKVKFNEDEAAWMMYDLASALVYLHGRNIVHRDVKTENLLCATTQTAAKGEVGLNVKGRCK